MTMNFRKRMTSDSDLIYLICSKSDEKHVMAWWQQNLGEKLNLLQSLYHLSLNNPAYVYEKHNTDCIKAGNKENV